ncbi:hypothetical protein Hanom_Chr16g01451331 [Helianthus anomalus]
MLNRCPTSSYDQVLYYICFYSINLNLFHLKDIILTQWWVKLKQQRHNMNKADQGCRFLSRIEIQRQLTVVIC